jgi:moderate conductance mechanosensitive channel
MHFRRLTGIFLFALCAAANFAAWAQTPAAPAPAANTAVSPEQAQRTLSILQDPDKRAALIETLQTIDKASAATPGLSTHAHGRHNHSTALVAGGVGAQLLSEISQEMSDISSDLASGPAALMEMRLFWSWVTTTVTDPDEQARLLDLLVRLAATLGGALIVDYLSRLALRRPFAALEARAMHGPARRSESHGPDAAPQSQRAQRVLKLRRVVARIPFALARLALELAPVALFAAAANLLLASGLGDNDDARSAILVLVKAYVLYRAMTSIVRALACHKAPTTGLFILPMSGARYLETWTRRIVGVSVWGFALANVAFALGLSELAYEAFVKIVALTGHILLVIVTLQCRGAIAGLIRAPAGRTDVVATLRNRLAGVWHYFAIFVNLGLWTVWALRIQNGYGLMADYAFWTIVVLALARAAWIFAIGGLERALHVAPASDRRFREIETRAVRYYPALRAIVSTIIIGVAAIALLQAWGINAVAWFRSGEIGGGLLSAAWTIGVAIAIALMIWESCDATIERYLARLSREAQYARAARLRTLLPTLRTVLVLAILIIVGLTALSQLGVNVAPLLAGAGIVGIAVGFGSQKLVQDVITGLFLLLENAMQVGDWITVAGLSGSVEYLSIRSIRLRASDGSVHVIPFSSVTTVTNSNRGIGNAAISVNLAFDEDIDRAGEVLKEIAAQMRKDKTYGAMMRGDLALWGVDRVDGLTVTLVGQIECTDSGRWPVQREFNRRMKIRFQELDVGIAHPSQTWLVADSPLGKRLREPRDAVK